jgi:hypothetical protein
MLNKKTKPRALKPSIKQLIVNRAITQRKIPREFLANELIKEIEELGEIAPTLETTKRYISKARNTENPLDEPWTIACCSEYNTFFPPDSIPFLISCKQWLRNVLKEPDVEYREIFGLSMSDFSIRQAIWMVRLKPLIEKTFAEDMAKDENARLSHLFIIPNIYVMAEITCEILNEHFTSAGLDSALASRDLDSLARITGLGLLAASKPTNCNGDCESCKYMKIPGFKTLCMPKPRKEGDI